jgi:hypothetical protein
VIQALEHPAHDAGAIGVGSFHHQSRSSTQSPPLPRTMRSQARALACNTAACAFQGEVHAVRQRNHLREARGDVSRRQRKCVMRRSHETRQPGADLEVVRAGDAVGEARRVAREVVADHGEDGARIEARAEREAGPPRSAERPSHGDAEAPSELVGEVGERTAGRAVARRPVTPHVERAVLEDRDARRGQRLHPAGERARPEDVLEEEQVGGGRGVRCPVDARDSQKRVDERREHEAPTGQGIVQVAEPEAVVQQDEPLACGIPDRGDERALELRQRGGIVAGACEYGGCEIGLSAEARDLAVHHRQAAVYRAMRYAASGEQPQIDAAEHRAPILAAEHPHTQPGLHAEALRDAFDRQPRRAVARRGHRPEDARHLRVL